LAVGYVGDRVAGTVTLIRDGDAVVIIDPGMVSSRSVILDPLRDLGVDPDAVTDVVVQPPPPRPHAQRGAVRRGPGARLLGHLRGGHLDRPPRRRAPGRLAAVAFRTVAGNTGAFGPGHLDAGRDRHRPGRVHPRVVDRARPRA
jgi:hypothetical protein